MATASLVLCFLTAKFGNTAVKHLKYAVLDFYDADELNAAKLYDVDSVKRDIHLPHIPERREGENSAVRIVDDIMCQYWHIWIKN